MASLLLWRSLVVAWQVPVNGLESEVGTEREQQLQQLLTHNPSQAEEQLRLMLQTDPTDAKALIRLALLWQPQGRSAAAGQVVTLATTLAPSQPLVLHATASYWLAQDNLAQALPAWLRLLDGRPQWQERLFPALLQVAEIPATRKELLRQLPTPLPKWWPTFMVHVARHAHSLETLLNLVQVYKARTTVAAEVQTAVLVRLERDAPYASYYLNWLELLTPVQRREAHYLYDGGFSQPLGDAGFGWRVTERPGVMVDRFESPLTGGNALRVRFAAAAQPGEILRQALLLAPGSYRLSAKVLLRELYSQGGVEWRIICAERPNLAPLATGPIWMGDAEWQDFSFSFSFNFKIGVECQRPVLQLWVRPAREMRVRPQGEIWVDQMQLLRNVGA